MASVAVAAALAFATATTARSNARSQFVDIHVDASTSGLVGDGSAARPFQSLHAAKEHLIRTFKDGSDQPTRRVLIQPGVYSSLAIDDAALSGTMWVGVGDGPSVVSGGIQIPPERFKPWDDVDGAFVASISGLNATDLGSMISGNEVVDCQHDKVGLSYGGDRMTLARWPNANPNNKSSPYTWARAVVGPEPTPAGFFVNLTENPDAVRLLNWTNEPEPWLHGYFEWDWADCYGHITDISRDANNGDLIDVEYEFVPDAKDGARWMGVNLLCELDAPGEFYIDTDKELVYFYPPGTANASIPVALTYQAGGVLNVTSDAVNVTLSNLEVRDGRHIGVLATGAQGLTIDSVVVHSVGTDGIDMTNSNNSVIRNSEVYDVGCSGVRATGGDAETLALGNLLIEDNEVYNYALWKRSYMPGIYWGGVNNTYRGNTVRNAPHNGFLGGGDFEDGVDCVFENNTLADLTFETIDSGGFYTCGQRGAAFTNRGNVLRGNTFERVRNTAGVGFQIASNQAAYFDDQMSAWLITGNTFIDCQVGTFTGGGRRNLVIGNRYVRVGTVHYLNNQGMTFDKSTINCTDVSPPFDTQCNTGGVEWMTTEAPAAKEYLARWPEMGRIQNDYPGWPAYTQIVNNSYCKCPEFSNQGDDEFKAWKVTVSGNVETDDC